MTSILARLIANPLGAFAVLALAAFLEAYGDSFFQVSFMFGISMLNVVPSLGVEDTDIFPFNLPKVSFKM